MNRSDGMDTETAIKEIKDRIELEWRHRFPADLAPDYIEALKLAVEALERRMPRKLKLIDELGIFGLCQCGEAVQPPEVYCWACGQLIDWRD